MEKYIKTYNSVAAFAATLKGEPKVNKTCSTRSAASNKKFAGVSTLAEAENLLVNGDIAAAEKIVAAGDITPPPTSATPRLRSAVAGCLPNIPNYLRGVPAQMYQVKSNARQKPVINIYVEATIYDGINEKSLAQKANFLANAITAVEAVGYRVNLFAICASRVEDRKISGFCVNIKEADAPLNVLNIAFPLLNKAFCRMCYLRWVDVNVPFSMDNGFSTYGCTCNASKINANFDLNGVVLSLCELVNYDRTAEDVVKTINDYISKI